MPNDDALGQVIERADQEYHKKFVQETHEYLRQQREAKERRDVKTSHTEQPCQAAETAPPVIGS